MKRIFYLLIIAVVIIAACKPTTKSVPIDTAAEAKVIRNLEEQWTSALQTKDIDKIMSFFSTDAVMMEPGMPGIVGTQAIRKTQFADTTILWNTYSGNIDIIEVSASGDLAYARGTDRVSLKKPEGLIEDVGKWVDVWKKIDGEWKCIVNIWNIDKP
jgi:ketosteroid isomerase-like protein